MTRHDIFFDEETKAILTQFALTAGDDESAAICDLLCNAAASQAALLDEWEANREAELRRQRASAEAAIAEGRMVSWETIRAELSL